MKRRRFFAAVGSALTLGDVKTKEMPIPVSQELTVYRDYHIKWTGWKSSMGNDLLVAQWVAYPLADKRPDNFVIDGQRPLLVSSYPGAAQAYGLCDTFNICILPGQHPILVKTPDRIKEKKRDESFWPLLKMVDCVMDHPESRGLLTLREWNQLLDKYGALPENHGRWWI